MHAYTEVCTGIRMLTWAHTCRGVHAYTQIHTYPISGSGGAQAGVCPAHRRKKTPQSGCSRVGPSPWGPRLFLSPTLCQPHTGLPGSLQPCRGARRPLILEYLQPRNRSCSGFIPCRAQHPSGSHSPAGHPRAAQWPPERCLQASKENAGQGGRSGRGQNPAPGARGLRHALVPAAEWQLSAHSA